MDEREIREKTAAVLAKQSGYEDDDFKLGDDLRLDLGLDSLDIANLELRLEEEFAVPITTGEMNWHAIHTVEDLQDRMVSLLAG